MGSIVFKCVYVDRVPMVAYQDNVTFVVVGVTQSKVENGLRVDVLDNGIRHPNVATEVIFLVNATKNGFLEEKRKIIQNKSEE